jgi:hypothetical protein
MQTCDFHSFKYLYIIGTSIKQSYAKFTFDWCNKMESKGSSMSTVFVFSTICVYVQSKLSTKFIIWEGQNILST